MTNRRPSHLSSLNFARRQLAAGLLALAAAVAGTASAGDDPERWRQEVAAVRRLAENDAPRAFREANRLQAALPLDATPADRALVLNLRSRAELYLALTGPAAADAENALAIARANGDKVGQAEADLNIALIALNQGRIAAIGEAAASALTVLDGVGRPDLLGEAMLHTAMVYLRNGQPESSVTLAMQALDMAQRSGAPLALAYALQGIGIAMEQSGRSEKAGEYYSRMQGQARAAGSKRLEAHATLGVAMVAGARGQYRAAESGTREAVAMFRAIGTPFNVGHALFSLADILRKLDRRQEALAILDEVVEIYERNPNKIGLWWTLNTRSADHLALGQTAPATTDAERAYALAKDIGAPLYLANSARQLAALAAAKGDYRRAYAFSRDAAETTALGDKKRAGEQIDRLTERYQSEARQRQIEELTRQAQRHALEQRWLWTVLAASVLLLAVTGGFLLRLRRSNRLLATLNTQVLRSQRQLKATLDAVPDLLLEIGLDGRFCDYHAPPRTKLVAPSAPDVIGKTVAKVLPPEAAEILMAALRDANEAGISTGRQIALEIQSRTFWFELSVARKPVDPGQEPRFIVLSRDITERKEGELKLHASEEAFRTLAENSPDIIIRYDLDCRRTYVNPAYERETGFSAGTVLMTTPSAVWGEKNSMSAAEYEALLRRVMETGEDAEITISWARATDGKIVHHALHMVAERAPDSRIKGTLAIGRNITTLLEAERRLQDSRTLLRDLAARRETAREEERRRIAREIHDELGQQLTALRLKVNLLNLQFGETQPALRDATGALLGMVDKTIQVARNVSTSLRPAVLDMGIGPALDWLAAEFTRHTGIPCELDALSTENRLSEERAVVLFRIAQESLTNAARYAHAKHVRIALDIDAGDYVLAITDDGIGFDPAGPHKQKSFGLVGMRERALAVGGEASILSEPGWGTTVRVRVPITSMQEEQS